MTIMGCDTFVTSASTTRPVNALSKNINQCYGLMCTETAGAAARVKLYSHAIAAPDAPTVAEDATAGSVTAGNHRVKVSYLTAQGETEPSAASSRVICTGSKRIAVSAIPTLSGAGSELVTGRNVYLNTAGVNEVQTLTLTAGAGGDTFKLTYDAVESSAVTIPGGGFAAVPLADIQTALTSIPALAGNYTATGSAGGPFTITFNGSLESTDVGAITVTSKTGAADGSVATTTAGVAQGTTWYKVTTGTTAVIADNTTTTYTINLADATLTGYNAAPSANTSGILRADIRLASSSTEMFEVPGGPVSAYLARCEITTGAATSILYGKE